MQRHSFRPQVLPFEPNVLPYDANGLPVESNVLPYGAKGLPFESNVLSYGANRLAWVPNVLPFGSNVLPYRPNVLPLASNGVPQQETYVVLQRRGGGPCRTQTSSDRADGLSFGGADVERLKVVARRAGWQRSGEAGGGRRRDAPMTGSYARRAKRVWHEEFLDRDPCRRDHHRRRLPRTDVVGIS
jgi:hypothetical protein